jgi:hypothetical protein
LNPSQQKLPDTAYTFIETGKNAWESGNLWTTEKAFQELFGVLREEEMGYV